MFPKNWSGPLIDGPYRPQMWSGPDPRSGWKSTPLSITFHYLHYPSQCQYFITLSESSLFAADAPFAPYSLHPTLASLTWRTLCRQQIRPGRLQVRFRDQNSHYNSNNNLPKSTSHLLQTLPVYQLSSLTYKVPTTTLPDNSSANGSNCYHRVFLRAKHKPFMHHAVAGASFILLAASWSLHFITFSVTH